MTELTAHINAASQRLIGSLTMSDKAVVQMGLLLRVHGHAEFAVVEKFGPVVAAGVSGFLGCGYFAKSRWFRDCPIHRTMTLQMQGTPPVMPVFHLKKNNYGYEIISPDEADIAEGYYETRLIEEVKVDLGIPA